MSHDNISESMKKVTLKGFGKKICKHRFRGTVFDHNVLSLYGVFHPIVPDMNVLG